MCSSDLEKTDGWAFHGRGLIQLTGRDNYDRFGKAVGIDFTNQPHLLAEPNYAALSAAWFWNKHGLNELADAQEHGMITKRINGGTLGLAERQAAFERNLVALSN